jgi:large subunit ribosomal protein L17
MRHRVFGKQLCVKEDQPFVEKLITMAKRSGLTSRRAVESRLNDRAIFRWVADGEGGDAKKGMHQHWDLPGEDAFEFNRYGELRKAPRLVQHLMTKVAPMYADRAGGYTRIVKLDKRRVGDQTDLCILQLVGKEEGAQVSGRRSNRRRSADKRTAFAAERRKGGAEAAKAE